VTVAFATETELEAYTGTSIATDRATLLLDMATGAIRAHTNQTLSRVTNDTVILPGNYTGVLELPERPVASVGAVTIGDTALTVDSDFVWDGRTSLLRGTAVTGVLVINDGPLISGRGDWGGPGAQVTVTYTHGFATIPDDIKGVCLALAARSLQSPDGVNSETVGSYSVSYSRTGGAVSLLDEERRLLDRYRRKVF